MRSILAVLLSLAGANALAQAATGAYLGIGVGQFDYEEDVSGLSFDDTAPALKLYGGYRFDETWAVEAAYGQTDDLKWSESGVAPILGNFSATLTGDYDFVAIRGLAHFNAFLVGLGYWDADLSANLTGTSDATGPFNFSASDSDSGASLIVGGEWDRESWAIRVELEYFDTESSVDAYLVGVGFHFRL